MIIKVNIYAHGVYLHSLTAPALTHSFSPPVIKLDVSYLVDDAFDAGRAAHEAKPGNDKPHATQHDTATPKPRQISKGE